MSETGKHRKPKSGTGLVSETGKHRKPKSGTGLVSGTVTIERSGHNDHADSKSE